MRFFRLPTHYHYVSTRKIITKLRSRRGDAGTRGAGYWVLAEWRGLVGRGFTKTGNSVSCECIYNIVPAGSSSGDPSGNVLSGTTPTKRIHKRRTVVNKRNAFDLKKKYNLLSTRRCSMFDDRFEIRIKNQSFEMILLSRHKYIIYHVL